MSTPKRSALTTEAIPKLIRQLALPASIGYFFNTMYNVVDTFVAGRLTSEALAALSLSFPLFFIIIALGNGMGSGATAVIGNEMGADNDEEAELTAKQVLSFGVVIALFVTLLGQFTFLPILEWLASNGDYAQTAFEYMQPIFLGSIFFIMSFMLNAILNAIGDTKSFRNLLIFGFFLNALIAPAFALGWGPLPALGVFGIGITTTITYIIGTFYLAYKVHKSDIVNNFTLADLKPDWRVYKEIAKQGIPASLSMLMITLGSFILTYFIGRFGEDAVAAYGTALRIEQIVLIPGVGINIAVLTLIAQNYGAQKYKRVQEVIKTSLQYILAIGLTGGAILILFGRQLMRLFTQNQDVIRLGEDYLFLAAWMTLGYGIVFVVDSVFRGIKKPKFPLIVATMRQIIIPLPVFWLLTSYLNYPVQSIWWALLVIVWSAAIIAYVYMKHKVMQVCDLK